MQHKKYCLVKIADIALGDFPLLLAPMEDVSDPPFRALCKEYGADLMYTEFISSEGLIRDAAKSVKKLDIFEYERPIGIQIFGSNIDSTKKTYSDAMKKLVDGKDNLVRKSERLRELGAKASKKINSKLIDRAD